MHTRTFAWLYFSFVLLTSALFSPACIAHTYDINQATLSLDNNEGYQLTITVDFIHLLKKHLEISGDDAKVTEKLNKLSFIEQKKLIENLEVILSQQTKLYFSSTKSRTEKNTDEITNEITNENTKENNEHSRLSENTQLNGLQLQHLKRILSQQANLVEYKTQLRATGDIPKGVSNIAVIFSPLFGDVVLNVIRPQHEIISAATLSKNYPIKFASTSSSDKGTIIPATLSIAADYIYQGFVHILPRGLDHILFVLALLLFAKRRSTLIWQISAFTLAHTITLALGVYGFVFLPSDIVEPLIALSIVYIGLENIYRAKQNTISHTRIPVIFAFGLLHGLGFASVLGNVGLPQSQYALSLVSFNIGVELGQLTVIALAFICLSPFRHKSWYQTKLVFALNITIAIIATYWLIERLN